MALISARNSPLVGTWCVERFEQIDSNGNVIVRRGREWGARLTYGADGRMEAWARSTSGQSEPLYFGTYEIAGPAEVVHRVDGPESSTLLGRSLHRRFEVAGDSLTILGARDNGVQTRLVAHREVSAK